MELKYLLSRSGQHHSNNVAFVHGRNSITYDALSKAVERLAGALSQLRVLSGSRVVLILEKGIPAVTFIYACISLEAPYVVVDPLLPHERIKNLTTLASPSLIIAQAETSLIASTAEKLILYGETFYFTKPEPPIGQNSVSRAAYIFFTSGSTGTPKGVVISVEAAAEFIDWAMTYFKLENTARLASVAPLFFDMSTDIFVACAAGATVYLIDAYLSLFPADLAGYLIENEITFWFSTPYPLINLSRFLENEHSRSKFSFTDIVFAGEEFPIMDLQRLAKCIPDVRYHNLYGPTETNVCLSFSCASKFILETSRPLPLGKPITKVRLHLSVNESTTQCLTLLYEVCVTGTTVMSGYLNDSEATDAAFFEMDEDRYYRTGDYVTKVGNELYFSGRRDSLFKRLGYRISTKEIENCIMMLPDVKECSVIFVKHSPEDFLIAVMSSDAEHISLMALVKDHVSCRLPSYMQPNQYRLLSELPKTSTGKLDRRALHDE